MLCVVGHRCCAEHRIGVQDSDLEHWRGRYNRCCDVGEGGAVGVVLNTGLVFGTLTHAYMLIHLYTPIYTYIHPYTPIYIVLICVDDIC